MAVAYIILYKITLTDDFEFSVTDGSCANPDLCCSGLNSNCHRKNCYCDVACLRFKDCCPDFKPTCLTGIQKYSYLMKNSHI